MADKNKRLKVAIWVIILMSVGFIVFSILAGKISEPYFARHYCEGGEVIAEFHKTVKGGYYFYQCKDTSSGTIANISPQIGYASLILMVGLIIVSIGFAMASTATVVTIWGPKKTLDEKI